MFRSGRAVVSGRSKAHQPKDNAETVALALFLTRIGQMITEATAKATKWQNAHNAWKEKDPSKLKVMLTAITV